MEDYVTYEQAIKLKELGFDWECRKYFNKSNVLKEAFDSYDYNHVIDYFNVSCSAPTLSQAQKWLREVKGIDLDITLYRDIDATKDIPIIQRYYNCEIAFGEDEEDLDEDFPTYEKALSAGIDKSLKILNNYE